jgi:hypothetical protein
VEAGAGATDGMRLLLPATPSPYVLAALYGACWEAHRAGAHTLAPATLRMLSAALVRLAHPLGFGFQQRSRWRAAECRHPTGRERMGSPTLQTLQESILLLRWVCITSPTSQSEVIHRGLCVSLAAQRGGDGVLCSVVAGRACGATPTTAGIREGRSTNAFRRSLPAGRSGC